MSLHLVAGLSDADMVWLLSRGKLRTLRPGERLVEAGRPVAELFFVLAGTLEVVRGDGACVATLGEGEVVGEMSLVEEHLPSVSVRARDRCDILATPTSAILDRFAKEPVFAARLYRAIAKFLSDRLRETTAALGVPITPPAEEPARTRFRRLVAAFKGRGS